MGLEITWIGHASFRVAGSGVFYIDPWKLPSQPHDADLVFVSHSHGDHCSPPDIAKVSRPDTVVLAPAETVVKLAMARAVDPGQEMTVGNIVVETVAAYNIGKQFHPRGHNWCGAVFTLDGRRIYYAGDTDQVPEMADLRDVDLAMLPVGGTYTMNPAEAARACAAIGCKAAIPYHWGDVVGQRQDAEAFRQAAPCTVHLLEPGQSVRL